MEVINLAPNKKKKSKSRVVITANKLLLTVALAATVATTATAAVNTAIVNNRNQYSTYDWYKNYAEENGLPTGVSVNFTANPDDDSGVFWDQGLDEASRKWFKEFAPYSSQVYWNNYSSTALTSYDSSMKRFQEESKYMSDWLDKNMKDIVTEGMNYEEAKVTCYTYILNSYLYDSHVKDNNLAKTMVDTGKGACAAYSSLYRDMINWMDFDENWKLTFDKDKAVSKLDMLIIGGNGHAWNALKDVDGTWRYYDLTFDSKESNALRTADNLKYYNLTDDEFYTDEVKMTDYGEWHRPKVENREGLHVYISGEDKAWSSGAAFDTK